MATLSRFNGESSGCVTPDPLGLHSSSWAQKGADSFEDDSQDDAPGDRTPDRVAHLNTEALNVKLQKLRASSAKCFANVVPGPPPGLTPLAKNCFEGNVMKVIFNSDSLQPCGARSSSMSHPPPPPHPELGFVRPPTKFKPAKPLMEEQVVSKGSIGHPHDCAPACKWVKRRGGCKADADCPNCHYCFWSKVHAGMQPTSKISTQVRAGMQPKPEPFAGAGSEDSRFKEAQSLANQLVALLGGEEPFGSKPKESKASVTTATQLSMGTMGHPHSCAEPCKYFSRKRGCMHGEACAKCHACLWDSSSSKEAKGFGSRASFGAVTCDMQVREAQDSSCGVGFSAAAEDVQGSVANPGVVISLNELLKTPPALSTNSTCSQSQKELPASQASHQSFHWQTSVGSTGHPDSCGPACKYVMKPKGCKDGRLCSHCHFCVWMRYSVKTGHKQPIETIGRMSY